MPKRIQVHLIIAGLLMICSYSFSQSVIEIEIINLRNDNGSLMLQLFDENENIIAEEKRIIRNNSCKIIFEDMQRGRYGIRFFHDENRSGKLELNVLGKPLEGYGFSNNVKGLFGPPPFEKWLFSLEENKKISLKPIY